MSPEQPINADVPVAKKPPADPPPAPKAEEKAGKQGAPKAPKPDTPKGEQARKARKAPRQKRQRRPIPGALIGIAGLVIVAVIFIVAAVVGGSGGTEDSANPEAAPAPSADARAETPSSQTAEELGFPGFATGNTTRVGGSDPAANAAAVALAVFPSTTPAQQPAAVALVDEEDWAGATAAAVLMSEPVRAPILISGPDGLPDASEEALEALDPQGNGPTRGAGAFAIGDVEAPDGTKATRVKVGDAAATAAAIAALRDRLFRSAPKQIVIAPSNRPDLAMPAAAWAARSGDPILFAAGDALPKPTATVLKRHDRVPVYVLGPSSAISSKAIRAIAKIGNEVHRVSGEDAVANAIAFARYGDGGFGWNVNDPGHGFVLARSDSPLDAAAAAPLSASGTWGPLLLTESASALPTPLREYFLDVKPGYIELSALKT